MSTMEEKLQSSVGKQISSTITVEADAAVAQLMAKVMQSVREQVTRSVMEFVREKAAETVAHADNSAAAEAVVLDVSEFAAETEQHLQKLLCVAINGLQEESTTGSNRDVVPVHAIQDQVTKLAGIVQDIYRKLDQRINDTRRHAEARAVESTKRLAERSCMKWS